MERDLADVKEVAGSLVFWGGVAAAMAAKPAIELYYSAREAADMVSGSETFGDVKGVAKGVGKAALEVLLGGPVRLAFRPNGVSAGDSMRHTADFAAEDLHSAGKGVGKVAQRVKAGLVNTLEGFRYGFDGSEDPKLQ